MGIIRRLLFVLQTDWYQLESTPWLIQTLKIVAQAQFTTDDVIKPIVAYLAANLHEGMSFLFPLRYRSVMFPTDISGAVSPRSVVSRIDDGNSQLKAEQVLQVLVSILHSPPAFSKFVSTLPFTRVCLLLLGDRPTPIIAEQILRLLQLGLKSSTSFSRKFELVSGWTTLRTVLPYGWSKDVHVVAFDIMFHRPGGDQMGQKVVTCPQIVPAIFASLQVQLDIIAGSTSQDHHFTGACCLL